METQFLLLELEGEGDGWAAGDSALVGRSDVAAGGDHDPPAPPAYALLLPLIDGGSFRATLRPPK